MHRANRFTNGRPKTGDFGWLRLLTATGNVRYGLIEQVRLSIHFISGRELLYAIARLSVVCRL